MRCSCRRKVLDPSVSQLYWKCNVNLDQTQTHLVPKASSSDSSSSGMWLLAMLIASARASAAPPVPWKFEDCSFENKNWKCGTRLGFEITKKKTKLSPKPWHWTKDCILSSLEVRNMLRSFFCFWFNTTSNLILWEDLLCIISFRNS